MFHTSPNVITKSRKMGYVCRMKVQIRNEYKISDKNSSETVTDGKI